MLLDQSLGCFQPNQIAVDPASTPLRDPEPEPQQTTAEPGLQALLGDEDDALGKG